MCCLASRKESTSIDSWTYCVLHYPSLASGLSSSSPLPLLPTQSSHTGYLTGERLTVGDPHTRLCYYYYIGQLSSGPRPHEWKQTNLCLY